MRIHSAAACSPRTSCSMHFPALANSERQRFFSPPRSSDTSGTHIFCTRFSALLQIIQERFPSLYDLACLFLCLSIHLFWVIHFVPFSRILQVLTTPIHLKKKRFSLQSPLIPSQFLPCLG